MYYAKKISGHFKPAQKVEGLKMVSDFWNSNVNKVKGFKGFMLMLDSNDSLIATNITVWESKEDMDSYYSGDEHYFQILHKIQQMMDSDLERSDYTVFGYELR